MLEPQNKNRFIRLDEVMHRLSLSRSSVLLRCARGEMPKPCSLGGRAVGWLESEIDEYIFQLIAASKNGGAANAK